MSILQPSTDSAERPWLLRIVSGLHAGASRPLAEQETLLIGSGDDCDVVLADVGIARHHALVALTADGFTIRALDAPLHVAERPLYPGDPVSLQPMQRIGLGEAALAVGREGDMGWANFAPGTAHADAGFAQPLPVAARHQARRWPLIGAIVALLVASVAIFAAVVPSRISQPPQDTVINELLQEFQVSNAQVISTDDGETTISGIIVDQSAQQLLVQRLNEAGLQPRLRLITESNIATQVAEVLRANGIEANTRYAGNGVVEVEGAFDLDALRVASQSRSMKEVPFLARIQPKLVDALPGQAPGDPQAAAARNARMRRALIVRLEPEAKPAYIEAADGTRYQAGMDVPGWGRLIIIGDDAKVSAADGTIQTIVIQAKPSFVDVIVGDGQQLLDSARANPDDGDLTVGEGPQAAAESSGDAVPADTADAAQPL